MTSSGGLVIAMVLGLTLILSGCQEKATWIKKSLPSEVGEWAVAGPDKIYDRQNLFDYIDGAAEVYLAYGFQQVLVRRYTTAGEPPIVLDLFDMGSAEDAFGVFSFEREGPDVGVGQRSEYAAGLLRFWKSRFFGCISTQRETPASKRVLFKLGRRVAALIPGAGHPPKLISFLPSAGLQVERIRYFHTHASLMYHYFISDRNILKLDANTQAAFAEYRLGGARCHLLLIRYPDNARATEALDSFLRNYLPDVGPDGAAPTEDGGWCAARRRDSDVLVVFEAPDRELARGLLEAVERHLQEVKEP